MLRKPHYIGTAHGFPYVVSNWQKPHSPDRVDLASKPKAYCLGSPIIGFIIGHIGTIYCTKIWGPSCCMHRSMLV